MVDPGTQPVMVTRTAASTRRGFAKENLFPDVKNASIKQGVYR
jgi:hypothetical protein